MRLRHCGPSEGGVAHVDGLDDILLELGAAIVLGRAPAHGAVVLVDIGDFNALRRVGTSIMSVKRCLEYANRGCKNLGHVTRVKQCALFYF